MGMKLVWSARRVCVLLPSGVFNKCIWWIKVNIMGFKSKSISGSYANLYTCKSLSTLSQKSATVVEFGDCRRCLAVFCDSRHFSATVWTGLKSSHHILVYHSYSPLLQVETNLQPATRAAICSWAEKRRAAPSKHPLVGAPSDHLSVKTKYRQSRVQ